MGKEAIRHEEFLVEKKAEGGSGLYAVVEKSYNVELRETPSFRNTSLS